MQSKREAALYKWDFGKAFVVIVVYVIDILMSADSGSSSDFVEEQSGELLRFEWTVILRKYLDSSPRLTVKLSSYKMHRR